MFQHSATLHQEDSQTRIAVKRNVGYQVGYVGSKRIHQGQSDGDDIVM